MSLSKTGDYLTRLAWATPDVHVVVIVYGLKKI